MAEISIKKSTADAVLRALFPEPEALLLRFEEVSKPAANKWDAERDRLRAYIQEHIEDGRYGRVILAKVPGIDQVYPNADGKNALENYIILDAPRTGADRHVMMLETMSDLAAEFAAEVLHELQQGKDHLIEWLTARVIAVGFTVENTGLYTAKPPIKCNITVLPEETAP